MTNIEELKNFDYSSIADRNQKEFFGIHELNNKMCIDVKRYILITQHEGTDEVWLPEYFLKTTEDFFFPERTFSHDYTINIFRDFISQLNEEWKNEYKPLFNHIKTPNEVYEDSRNNEMLTRNGSDDFDEVDCNALFDAIHRTRPYNHIVNSLYCTFISRLCTEIDRVIMTVISDKDYNKYDFKFDEFIKWSEQLNPDRPFNSLKKYNCINLLHKINNFLKHNTLKSYNTLKKCYKDNVASIDNGKSDIEYQNGMYAGDWIVLKDGYIDDIFDKLIVFFEDYCSTYFNEDIEKSKFNYSEFFIAAFNDIKDLGIHYGWYM